LLLLWLIIVSMTEQLMLLGEFGFHNSLNDRMRAAVMLLSDEALSWFSVVVMVVLLLAH